MTKQPEDGAKASIPATELNDGELEKATGGSSVKFEYGGLQIKYVEQKPDGTLPAVQNIP